MAGPIRIPQSRFRSALAAVCLISAATAPAAAQVIRGRVVDRPNGAPIPNVSVVLSDTSGEVVGSARTNDGGDFEIKAGGAGVYRLAFKRIGFQDRELVLDAGTEAVVWVPEDVSSLEPLAVELEAAAVVGKRDRRLERTGFYERRREGHGSFITREEFEINNPSETTDVLRRLRGIRVTPNANYGARPGESADTRRYLIGNSRGERCPTMFFVNDVYIGSAQDKHIDLDMTIRVHDIEAIEVYSGAGQLPERFNIMGAMCGAVVLWTR